MAIEKPLQERSASFKTIRFLRAAEGPRGNRGECRSSGEALDGVFPTGTTRRCRNRLQDRGVVDVPVGRRSTTNAARWQGTASPSTRAESAIPDAASRRGRTRPASSSGCAPWSPICSSPLGYMLLLKAQILSVPRVMRPPTFMPRFSPPTGESTRCSGRCATGERWCGLTVHEMGAGLDTGDIMFQVRVPGAGGRLASPCCTTASWRRAFPLCRSW